MGKLTLPLLVAILLVTTGCCRADSGDLETLKVGLDSGKEIADFLKDQNFHGSLAKIASKASVFLSAISPALALILAVIPGGESELERGFRELHNRLDTVSKDVEKVMELIEWESAKATYAESDLKIRALGRTFRDMIDTRSNETRRSNVMKFRAQFESGPSGHDAVSNLLDSIVGSPHIARNLADASVKFTKRHRRRVQKFMMDLAQLVIKGAELEIAYYTMKGDRAFAALESRRWATRLQQMKVKMEAVDSQCERSWYQQSNEDLDDLLARNRGKSNKDFIDLLNNHLTEKFYWRTWFIAVYDEFCSHSWTSSGDYGWDKQTNKQKVSQRGGHERLCRDGRSTVVASSESTGFDANWDRKAKDALSSINRGLKNAWAGDWYRLLANEIRGWEFKFVGIICTDCNLWYMSSSRVITKALEYGDQSCWTSGWSSHGCDYSKRHPMFAILFY